jgi:hypothetical protein
LRLGAIILLSLASAHQPSRPVLQPYLAGFLEASATTTIANN